jgi:hypothetical protein
VAKLKALKLEASENGGMGQPPTPRAPVPSATPSGGASGAQANHLLSMPGPVAQLLIALSCSGRVREAVLWIRKYFGSGFANL